MSGQRYTPEFKDEAIKLITERGYSVTDVAERLGVSQCSGLINLDRSIGINYP